MRASLTQVLARNGGASQFLGHILTPSVPCVSLCVGELRGGIGDAGEYCLICLIYNDHKPVARFVRKAETKLRQLHAGGSKIELAGQAG